MNLAEFSIKNQVLSVIVILLSLFAGWNAYKNMPRFEDPEFIIREAVIFTRYPGASPEEVANEVSKPLETALQQMQEIKTITTKSFAGLSEINVKVKISFSKSKEDLQVIWTRLRNKIRDTEPKLPKEAQTPVVNDDFGDIFGLSFFVTGDDYSSAELHRYAKQLQKEILQIKGVGKVKLDGVREEVIYVDISRAQTAILGSSIQNIYNILSDQNAVISAGNVQIGDQKLIIDPSGAIDTIESIKNLLVSNTSDGKIIYLKDIANIYRGYKSPEAHIVRYNGKRAIALGVSNVSGGNVVVIGKAVNAKLKEAISRRPIGMEVEDYYQQGKIVEASVNSFMLNVIAALVIVIITLLIFMGAQSAAIMAFILLITVAATLATMQIMDVPIHRISLGALIIALGMMVDNAVVITEAILVGLKQGRKKLEMAKEIVSQTIFPLLGGTMVGIIAFAPIGFAPGVTAEYTGDLFWVVMIALLYSWIFAMTITPLACYWVFPDRIKDAAEIKKAEKKKDEKKTGTFFTKYKIFIRWVLHHRAITVGSVLSLFILSIWGTQFMKRSLFPQSTSPQMVIDYRLPEGTIIERTERDLIKINDFVSKMEGVNAIQMNVGGGAIRYMLTYTAESASNSYGQLLVRVDDYKVISEMMPKVRAFIQESFPEANSKTWRFILGPGGGANIEAEFFGPDPKVLRNLSEQAKAILRADPQTISIQDDWREPVAVIEPIYSETKGRRAGISRKELAKAINHYYTGTTVGTYREGDDLLPIISRISGSNNATISDLRNIEILSKTTGKMVPIGQVTNGFKTIWRDGIINSENRIFRIKAQASVPSGVLSNDLQKRIRPQIETIKLPSGYGLEWGGDTGNETESNGDLMSTIPLGFLAMVLVVVILFGKIRQPLVIWSVVPLALIGVVFGLVVTGVTLEFMGILGLLSLSGLLIQNGIILVDRMDTEIDEGKARFDAIVDSAASRVRPVVLGSFTTALGVIPLLFDAFFQSMAVVIVFGLTFATILTLVIVPVLYAIFLNIRNDERAA